MPQHQDEEREKTALAKFVANLAYAQVSNRLCSVTVATESDLLQGRLPKFLRGNCPISGLGLYTVPA